MSGSLHNSVVALEFVQMCLESFVRGVIGQRQSVSTHWASVNRETVVVLINTSCSSCFPLPNCKTRTKKTWLRLRRAALENAHISNHSQFFFKSNLGCGEKVVSKFGELRDRRERKLALGWKVKARRKRHLRSWLNLQHLRY